MARSASAPPTHCVLTLNPRDRRVMRANKASGYRNAPQPPARFIRRLIIALERFGQDFRSTCGRIAKNWSFGVQHGPRGRIHNVITAAVIE
ncbi:unnamed protein product, partial [Iphiclides podalirius]